MNTSTAHRGGGLTQVLAWLVLPAGLAILVVELVRGDGISLVGAGAAVVGGAVLSSDRRSGGEPEGRAGGGEGS